MKKIILMQVGVLFVAQSILAQGTIYLSNLGQTSTGSLSVGSDSWLAGGFHTGNNLGGYLLNAVQLGLADASGNPGDFVVTIHDQGFGPPFGAVHPGSNLDTLSGSLNPVTSGIFTYTPTSELLLSPNAYYFIVLTSGTMVANGSYEWALAGANSYNPDGGWNSLGGVWNSSDGSLWSISDSTYLQFALTATPVPEPSILSLFALGGLFLGWRCRKTMRV